MSNKKPNRKKVIVSTSNERSSSTKKLNPTSSKANLKSKSTAAPKGMLFGKQNFYLMLLGIGLVALGMFLMVGGNQAPSEWNPDEIYSFRRVTLAPLVILAGLIVNIFAIFHKDKTLVEAEA